MQSIARCRIQRISEPIRLTSDRCTSISVVVRFVKQFSHSEAIDEVTLNRINFPAFKENRQENSNFERTNSVSIREA